MFLRHKIRRKDGKVHRAWSVVENRRAQAAILKVGNFWDSRISKSLIQGWDAALALPR